MSKYRGKWAWPALTAVAMLALLAGGLACSSTPLNPPAEGIDLDIIRSALSFIGQHHAEAAPFTTGNIKFTPVAISDKRKIGYNSVDYSGGGWTVTVGHASTAVIIEEINASYQNGKIVWTGRSQDGVISEDSYNYTQ